ncbi:Mbov_0397 family ICE element conjugal transfer ATPase [Spiroplasma endosymbiont of Danaus chrysippus]|uniref:Mbov_0397 family ICE element conjugal transfer ATPase n=1 Tax=Spiroplasma endosymbiont of Danaus chrysippus TaxID=2691041 RepID=UPI00157A4510|nr:ATP-binding protein [Spiroplasma endosymbiont of Danaus chrysippus]
MKFLIPKTIKFVKLQIWRSVGLIDLLIILMVVGFASIIILLLQIDIIFKILAVILVGCATIPLTFYWQPRKKGWEIILLWFKFHSKNRYYKSEKNSQILVPFKKIISKNVMQLNVKNTNYTRALLLEGFNITLLSNEEASNKIKDLAAAFKIINISMSLIKIDMPLDITAQTNFYKEQLEKIDLENISEKAKLARKFQMISAINANNEIQNQNEMTQPFFYLFFYSSNQEKLKEEVTAFKNYISRSGVKASDINCFEMMVVYSKLINSNENASLEEMFTTKKEETVKSKDLTNDLAIKELLVHKNNLEFANCFQTVYNIYDYPFEVSAVWLANLVNIPNTSLIFTFNSISEESAKKQLNKAMQNLATLNFMTKSLSERRDYDYHYQSLNELLDQIAGGGEKIFNTNMYLLINGADRKQLKQNISTAEYEIKNNNMKFDKLYYRQLEAFLSVMPDSADWFKETGHEMPCLTIGASFPFLNQELNDKQGLFLGFNESGNKVFFDQRTKSSTRKNHNQLIIGTSGSGKSYASKKEVNYQIMLGHKVIVIDPEREYRDLCNYHDGSWIDVGDGSSGNINPFQITLPLSDDNTNDNNTRDILAPHMQFLEQFLNVATGGLTRNESSLLMIYVNLMYEKFGITSRTKIHLLKPNQFPIFQDLYDIIESDMVKKEEIRSKNELKNLLIILSRFATGGTDANLWNAHTNINSSSLLQVYDLYTLTQSGNKRLVNAQMFLILKYIENEVRKNKNDNEINNKQQWISITIDEAHLLIDKEFPAALLFMYQIVKRIRKYTGMINIITQNINDFLGSEEIKKYTTAIINSSQYLKVLNLQPHDLAALNELYSSYGGISANETDFIARAKVGECLFAISSLYRMCLNINVSDAETQAIKNIKNKEIEN